MEKNQLSDLGKMINFEVKYPEPQRGEIYLLDLSDMSIGSTHIMQKSRPGLIIQNNIGNLYSDMVIVSLLTSTQKKDYPMHMNIKLNDRDSVIMFEQIMSIDKNRLVEKMGELSMEDIKIADEKLMYSLQLNRYSLNNVEDINIINQQITKTRENTYIGFTIEILFINNIKQEIKIKLDKLKEFDSSIDENIEFDELKRKLNCCKGLNWLVNNKEE